MISSGITRSVLALVVGWCLSFQVLAYKEADLEKLKTTGSCESCDLSGADLYEIDLFNDFDSLLALINNLDLVITIDNINAQLAGSIAKKNRH